MTDTNKCNQLHVRCKFCKRVMHSGDTCSHFDPSSATCDNTRYGNRILTELANTSEEM